MVRQRMQSHREMHNAGASGRAPLQADMKQAEAYIASAAQRPNYCLTVLKVRSWQTQWQRQLQPPPVQHWSLEGDAYLAKAHCKLEGIRRLLL